MKYEIGQILYKEEALVINENREAVEITVRNSGDRTIQVCSHYHFFESNDALLFDREKAYGMHLDIPSGTAVRFEPGADHKVGLVPFGGKRKIYGFAGLVMGDADDLKIREEALKKYKEER